MRFRKLTITTVIIVVSVISPSLKADSRAENRSRAEDRIQSACNRTDRVTNNCINTCIKYGFKDSFHEGDYSNASNKTCQFALTTHMARSLKTGNSDIKFLKRVGDNPQVCKGAQYQVTLVYTEPGCWRIVIKPKSGKITKLSQCGTAGDNYSDYESGPLKNALVKEYDGGQLLFLNARHNVRSLD